jgi:ubiquinone/menaquinone biosynthesis C-methylase UbiE
MHCLCSIPDPQNTISAIYNLLKPGGQLLLLEHIASNYWFTRMVQTFYTKFGWKFVLDGCEANRDTLRWILEAARRSGGLGWEKVELKHPLAEGWWSVVPRVYGRLVKKS